MFVVIGTTTVDLIVRGILAYASLDDGFRAGNLVFCDEPLLMLMGGNGGNSATVLGRWGAQTAVCSSIGQDHFGDWLAEQLAAQQVSLEGLMRQPDLATSSSTILLNNMENQVVFHHKGATDALAVTVAHETLYARAEVLLASSYPLFPLMRAGGFARALQLSHEAGGITALDIGPAIGEPVMIKEIAPLFQHLDFLIANTHELMMCAGAVDWETAVADLLGQGCRCVVIKRGTEGAALRAHGLSLDVAAFPVTANISVGAGDSFNAGFLYTLWAKRLARESGSGDKPVKSRDRSQEITGPVPTITRYGQPELLEALRFGSAVAALVMDEQQGVLGAPTLAEVERYLHEREHGQLHY